MRTIHRAAGFCALCRALGVEGELASPLGQELSDTPDLIEINYRRRLAAAIECVTPARRKTLWPDFRWG
jgi:hypothetical protein